MPDAYFRQLQLGPMKNFVYLLGAQDSRDVAVVDPAWDVPAILQAVDEDHKRIVGVMVTHSHGDHINGLAEVLKACDVPVYAQALEIQASDALSEFASSLKPLHPSATLNLGHLPWTFLHTPGHTVGSQCIFGGGVLVTGDTLFVNACGRCDLPGGNAKHLYHSLHHVLGKLPLQTLVLPGHDYGDVPVSSIAREWEKNPYYQHVDETDFCRFRNRQKSVTSYD